MKNPLVDALRQAQESDSDPSFQDTVATDDRTPTLPDDAGMPPAPAEPTPDIGELDLELEIDAPPLQDVPAAEPEPPTEHDVTPAGERLPLSLRFTRTLRLSVGGGAGARPDCIAPFERLSAWTPVVCLLLSIVTAILVASWAGLSGTQPGSALSASRSIEPALAREQLSPFSSSSRFPLRPANAPNQDPEPVANVAEPMQSNPQSVLP